MEVENTLFVEENGLPRGPLSTSMLVPGSIHLNQTCQTESRELSCGAGGSASGTRRRVSWSSCAHEFRRAQEGERKEKALREYYFIKKY